jgi:hypothetical protein
LFDPEDEGDTFTYGLHGVCHIPEDGTAVRTLFPSHQTGPVLTRPMDLGLGFITNRNESRCFYTIEVTLIFRSFDIQLDIIPKYAKYLSSVGINAVLGEFPFMLYIVTCQQCMSCLHTDVISNMWLGTELCNGKRKQTYYVVCSAQYAERLTDALILQKGVDTPEWLSYSFS